MKDFLWILTIAWVVLMGSLWLYAGIKAYDRAHPVGISAYDATKACQQIASQATAKTWSYKACMQEMQKALAPTAISYQT